MNPQNNTTNHRQPPSSAVGLKQNMFEKPLTPSDVGKLNRLVIPKQQAEKYFPLCGGAAMQTGLLLSFEDQSGKQWRFRYSYWNSSQSYVLTKGWSRYVKEKRLDAGDVVLFQRDMLDFDRMFIGWRRRRFDAVQDRMAAFTVVKTGGAHVSELSGRMLYDAQTSYPTHHLSLPFSLPYQRNCLHAVDIYENVDTYQRGEVSTRRLRLFGVNLECQDTSEPSHRYGSSHGG